MIRKQPKPRSFDYRPRYYDPEKERSRIFRPSGSEGEDSPLEGMRGRISRHFREYNSDGGKSSPFSAGRQVRQSNIRLVVILALLLLAAFWLLSTWLPRVVALVE
jgi:hypothetical protein